MRLILILLMLATQAQAQAVYPPVPAGARIGYLVVVPDSPVYALAERGSYAAKRHSVTWQLRQSMEEAIAPGLTQAGLVPVQLASIGVKPAYIRDLFEMEGKGTLQEGNLRWKIP